MDLQELFSTILNWILTVGVKVVIALVILIISFKIINVIGKKIDSKASDENHLDKTLYRTLSYVFRIIMKIVVGVCLISYVGIDTTGMAALIASLGVGVGLAVNGTLSNFAGGMLLIITRPFKDDDFISACGYDGTVEDIHITYTKLITTDNRVVYLPNGTLSTGTIVNVSEKDTRRADFTFSIAYSADFDLAKKTIENIFASDSRVLKTPAPMVVMSAHSDSSIEITARAWVNRADYWTVHFDTIEAVKKAFDKNGIEIPFSQLDVHVKKD